MLRPIGAKTRAILVLICLSSLLLFLAAHPGVISVGTLFRHLEGAISNQPGSHENAELPYVQSRFSGQGDLRKFQKPPQQIFGFVLAGRRETLSILDCYLQRNLVRNGGWLDGVIFEIATRNDEDLAFVTELVASVPEYIGHRTAPNEKSIKSKASSQTSYAERYAFLPTDALYIKIDDDVVFFEDHAIKAVIKRLVEHPEYLIVSGNVLNQPAMSWVHYHLGTALPFYPEQEAPPGHIEDDNDFAAHLDWRPSKLPTWTGPVELSLNKQFEAPYKNSRWLPGPAGTDIAKTPMGILGRNASDQYNAANSAWRYWPIAAQQHYSFLTHLENDELWRYKFDIWDYHYDRLSINFMGFRGEDLIKRPVLGSDEVWWSMRLSHDSERHAVMDGTAMVVHYSFGKQYRVPELGYGGLNETDIHHRYRAYAKEFICGRPWGSRTI